jgi:lipopolysaccharide export system protein LptC
VTKPRQRLRHIQPRRRYSGGGAGHTWFVRITKFMLPVAALVIIGVVFGKMSQDQTSLKIAELPPAQKTTPGQIDLVMPKYEGLDAKNHPYTISADRAHRVMEPGHDKDQVVAMEKPKGDIALEDGSWISLQAADGIYNNSASTLHLSGGVVLFHDSGYEMHMKDVDVDVKTRHAKTDSPVQGQGPAGAIDAQNLEISQGGDLIVFGGPLRLTLWNLSGPKEKRG